MELTVEIARESDQTKWDEIIARSSYGTIFHTWSWLKLAEEQTKSRFVPLMLYKGTELVGLYPFFIAKKGPINLAFSPPPKAYLLYLGPVIVDYQNLRQDKKESIFIDIQNAANHYLFNTAGCRYSRIRTSPGLFDSRPLKWTGYEVDPLYTYRVDLRQGMDEVWKNFDRKLRNEINKAIKSGVTVRQGDWEDLVFIYNRLSERYLDQGVVSSDYIPYLQKLYDRFYPDNLKIFVAEYKGEKVGGTINLVDKNIMYLWVGIPKTTLPGLSPNDLVQWEAMKWSSEHGLTMYEEMDAGDDSRLRYFKSKYNPDLEIWYSATKYSSAIFRLAEKILKQ